MRQVQLLQLTVAETKAWRDEVRCPRSHSKWHSRNSTPGSPASYAKAPPLQHCTPALSSPLQKGEHVCFPPSTFSGPSPEEARLPRGRGRHGGEGPGELYRGWHVFCALREQERVSPCRGGRGEEESQQRHTDNYKGKRASDN